MPLGYTAFGISLSANRPVPGLVALPAATEPDVQVWLGGVPPWLNDMRQAPQEVWYVSPGQAAGGKPALIVWKSVSLPYFRLKYSDGTEFVVDRSGSRVWGTWPEALTVEDAATYLLGPVFGFLLRLRGITCLHASAIALGKKAIALLGLAGAGKSTTAAAFARRGYPVLSDDIVTLSNQDGVVVVQPGYPHLRLWPAAVKALYGAENSLPRLTPTWEKCYLDLTENGCRFQREPLPLAAVYILDERRADLDSPSVETVPLRQGLITLVGNTYMNYLLDKAMRAQEFESLCQVAARVPLRRVTPHADPAYLSRLCDLILADFQGLTRSFPGVIDVRQD